MTETLRPDEMEAKRNIESELSRGRDDEKNKAAWRGSAFLCARLEEARRTLDALVKWKNMAEGTISDLKRDLAQARTKIDHLEADAEQYAFVKEQELKEARRDLDQNAADVMRLQGELAEARQAGGHAQNCLCHADKSTVIHEGALMETGKWHEHPYRDPRCAPATAGEPDEKVKAAHEAVDDLRRNTKPTSMMGEDYLWKQAHDAIDAIPVAKREPAGVHDVAEFYKEESPAPGEVEEAARNAHAAVNRIEPIYRKGWNVVGTKDAHAAIDHLADLARRGEVSGICGCGRPLDVRIMCGVCDNDE